MERTLNYPLTEKLLYIKVKTSVRSGHYSNEGNEKICLIFYNFGLSRLIRLVTQSIDPYPSVNTMYFYYYV